jgi:hypothetical protein
MVINPLFCRAPHYNKALVAQHTAIGTGQAEGHRITALEKQQKEKQTRSGLHFDMAKHVVQMLMLSFKSLKALLGCQRQAAAQT